MRNYPEEIETLSLHLAALHQQIAETRDRMREIEVREQSEVIYAAREDGRPLYTNDTQRALALEMGLSGNVEHRALKGDLLALERKRDVLKAQIERVRGEFKIFLLDRQEDIASMHAPNII